LRLHRRVKAIRRLARRAQTSAIAYEGTAIMVSPYVVCPGSVGSQGLIDCASEAIDPV